MKLLKKRIITSVDVYRYRYITGDLASSIVRNGLSYVVQDVTDEVKSIVYDKLWWETFKHETD